MRLGALVGSRLKGGECIELISDLGGGKTAFVRGLAKGAGSPDQVASPSFTIMRVYRAPNFEIHHYDLYRLEETGVVGEELGESLADPAVCTIIEWAGLSQHQLPADRLSLEIVVSSPDQRILKFKAGTKHKHLLKGLKSMTPRRSR